MAPPTIAAILELGSKRVFAAALDWPGWCRSGRDEDQALTNLAAYMPRFARVAEEGDLPFRLEVRDGVYLVNFAIAERLPGSATTDFGAPGAKASRDREPITKTEADRLARLVEASWRVLDQVVAKAPPQLRKGPRGGGRDRDPMFQHVLGAESAYARKLGIRLPEPDRKDHAAIAELHGALAERIRNGHRKHVVEEKAWPVPYAARRIAWHTLDHAWEMEDRAEIS
jgi:hypothetical protein